MALNKWPARLWSKPDLNSVRQTVLSASVDSNGYPNYITAGTGLSVDLAATAVPIVLTAAMGANNLNGQNYVARVTQDTSITGLTTFTTCFLWAEIDFDGNVTYGHDTLLNPPNYIWGTPSTVFGVYSFCIPEMQGYLGDGTNALKTSRVYLGEAVTDGTSVTSVVNYALQGKYQSTVTAITSVAGPNTYGFNSNIGIYPCKLHGMLRENNTYKWSKAPGSVSTDAAVTRGVELINIDRNTLRAYVPAWGVFPAVVTDSHSSAAASGELIFIAERGW